MMLAISDATRMVIGDAKTMDEAIGQIVLRYATQSDAYNLIFSPLSLKFHGIVRLGHRTIQQFVTVTADKKSDTYLISGKEDKS